MASRFRQFRSSWPNLTAMVDIVMCILIFFMLGMVLQTPELYLQAAAPAIVVPTQGPSLGSEPVNVTAAITLQRIDGRTYASAFGRQTADLSGELGDVLSQRAAQSSGDIGVIIRAGSNVPYQDVLTAYDQCHKAQLKRVQISATF
jgi:biopolymer transport protein ExbD